MATPIQNILEWWKQYAKPTATQVAETFNSFRHKNDSVPAAEVGGLDALLQQKADKVPFEFHRDDNSRHIQEITVDGAVFWYKRNSPNGTAAIPKFGDLGLNGILNIDYNGVIIPTVCTIKFLETGASEDLQNWTVIPRYELIEE